jgi:hypothetical protein
MTAPALVSAAGAPAALTPAALLYGDFTAEHAATRRILERYPDGKGDWRPHERSRTLVQLATHVADVVNRGTAVIETDGMDIGARQPLPPMDTARDLLAHFEAGVRGSLRRSLPRTSSGSRSRGRFAATGTSSRRIRAEFSSDS